MKIVGSLRVLGKKKKKKTQNQRFYCSENLQKIETRCLFIPKKNSKNWNWRLLIIIIIIIKLKIYPKK